jgi:hypothetical protein
MRLKVEGLPTAGAGDVQGMTIRDGIHPDGEERIIVLRGAVPVRLTGVIRVHRAGAIPVLPAVVVLPVEIPTRSAMPAGSSPAAAGGRAMPVIPPAVAVAAQVKGNLLV